MSIHVAGLVHPEIHWNTGNAGRSCLAAGATLHLIEPLGFSLDEREVQAGAGSTTGSTSTCGCGRAGSEFEAATAVAWRAVLLLDEGDALVWDAPLGTLHGAVLVFGRETGGLPPEIHERYRDRFVAMPILSPHVRSLNLSTSVEIAVYEVLRRRDGGPTHR